MQRPMIWLACAGLLLVGCAAPRPTPPAPQPRGSQEEFHAAMGHVVQCMSTAVPQLDDGMSGADVVAKAVVLACGREFRGTAEVRARALTPGAQRMFYELAETSYWELAMQDVLRYRAWRRTQAQP